MVPTTTKGIYVSGDVGIEKRSVKLEVVPESTRTAGLFTGTTSDDMVRITQLGSGNVLTIELNIQIQHQLLLMHLVTLVLVQIKQEQNCTYFLMLMELLVYSLAVPLTIWSASPKWVREMLWLLKM